VTALRLSFASLAFAALTIATFATFSNASAMKFSFDPQADYVYSQPSYAVPAVIISLVAILGISVMIGERKKAKGIWFSNPGSLR